MSPLMEKLPIAIGAVIAVLVQIIVAPNIQVYLAVPDFILCYVVAVAIANARDVGYIMPFLLGLVYDFIGSGPIGAMAFVCVAITFVASSMFRVLDNETIFMPILVIVTSCFLGDVSYALLMIACGQGVGLLDALLYIGLPCGLYDTLLTFIVFPLVLHFEFKGNMRNEMKIIDTGERRF